jgi:hypothetical protein
VNTNLDRYKNDLKQLLGEGDRLLLALQFEHFPEQLEKQYKDAGKKELFDKVKEALPPFASKYQSWYSEAQAVIKQLLPDRLTDFARHYEKPKSRKAVTYENYVIEDGLQGLVITRGWQAEKVVGPDALIPQFQQQLNILRAVEKRFESSLFDIRQLAQADLFDSELDAARELLKHGFARASRAIAGVLLEKHLGQVCINHHIKVAKKDPTISTLNDLLKVNDVIETPQWRFIQHLGDLRNLCDHDKKKEPLPSDVGDLISGVEKVMKTLF